MTTEITVFEHEMFGSIRIVDQDGEPWFIAKDVALALGFKRQADAIRQHCKGARPLDMGVHRSPNGTYGVSLIIPESDVYRLVMRSELPRAVELQDWVCEEVLPSIRKTGSYSLPETTLPMDTFPKLLPAWDAAKALAERLGYKGNQAILTACKIVKRAHQVDLPALMGGTNLVSEEQELLLTPTELGTRVGLGAQAVNKILERRGYQISWKRGQQKAKAWKLTDKGEELGVYLDVGKKYSDGTPIKQIKWRETVIKIAFQLL